MKTYKNFESIERDLKILNLERQIALEEIKHLKQDYKDCLKLPNWMQSGMDIISKISTLILIKKAIKK
jgi:hypothetical protein